MVISENYTMVGQERMNHPKLKENGSSPESCTDVKEKFNHRVIQNNCNVRGKKGRLALRDAPNVYVIC